MKTIAFFGHSRINNETEIKEKLVSTLNTIISNEKFVKLLIGCHGDFDKIALSSCLNYANNTNTNVSISVILTSLSFLKKDEYGYSKADMYKKKNCETLFYNIEETYYKNRITYSNKKMVDDSNLIICYVNMKSYKSGAKTAVNYAIKQKKQIVNLFYT